MSELDVLEWFMGASSSLGGVMEAITLLATNWLIWLVIAFLLTCFKDYRRTGIAVIVALVVTYIVTDLIMKPLIDRPRPFEVSDIIPLVDPPSSASFPSGHTASSFAAATVLFMRDRRLGIPSYVFAALVGISRLCLGVHWPTDVLAGAVIGAILAYACVKILYRYIPYFRDGDPSEEGRSPDPGSFSRSQKESARPTWLPVEVFAPIALENRVQCILDQLLVMHVALVVMIQVQDEQIAHVLQVDQPVSAPRILPFHAGAAEVLDLHHTESGVFPAETIDDLLSWKFPHLHARSH